ncbi:MAG: phosphonate metabolism protein/1,5-bisphosphokinase (PRPP-forming) PhnN [Zoogloeaceae bacterium]|jgi:ribose 1,5-bisphosphokinase|nr:phosphonate metabolism protein/1,5-bisphosphokinase (PRPP-forming) PhnN [Zoogloeaceae bacterium]
MAELLYLVGASGSGKDSIMRHARQHLAHEPGIVFAHRYITRAADAGGENHIALTPLEFEARRALGLFALDWASNGHCYGIGIEIDAWLARGATVLVNGSREHLPQAQKRYPCLRAVRVEVSPETLRTRLRARGRESEADIERRLERHAMLCRMADGATVIDNNGDLACAGEALIRLIREGQRESVRV